MARGSIRKTTGKSGVSYKVTYDIPALPGSKRAQRSKTFRTEKAAERFLTTVRHAILDNREAYRVPVTFRELAERYLATLPPSTRSSTRITIETRLRTHLLPAWGEREVQTITSPLAQTLADQIAAHRSPQTVRLVIGLASAIFRRGIGWGATTSNPCVDLRLPKVAVQTRSETWDAATLRKFFALYGNRPFAAVYRLIAMTGMRRGEALALIWGDYDTANSRIVVRRTLRWNERHEWVMGENAKTPGSERAIALDHETAIMLRDLRGDADDAAFIFADEWGDFLNPDRVTKRFVRFVRSADLPPMTVHGLRHTHATLLGAAGVDLRTIMERLGHTTPTMTLGRYMHGSVEADRKAATTFAGLLGVSSVSEDGEQTEKPLQAKRLVNLI